MTKTAVFAVSRPGQWVSTLTPLLSTHTNTDNDLAYDADKHSYSWHKQTPPPPTSVSISLTHWRTLVALRRDWGRCVPLNMHRRLSEDHTGMLAHIDKDPPLHFSNTECVLYFCMCVWHSEREHPLHVVRATLLSNMFSCCSIVLAYITQKPAVCCVSMSLPVQQFVLHIPRHHHIVRGMMLIGLKVWKSPLFYPWGSLPKMHTHIHLCPEESASADTRPHEILVLGVMFSMLHKIQSPKVPCSHYRATVHDFLTVSGSVWCFYKWLFTCCSNHSLNRSCECLRTGKYYLCYMLFNCYYLFSYFSFSCKQDVLSSPPPNPPAPTPSTPCHMTLCDTIQGFQQT